MRRILVICMGLAFGAGASQGPEFAQQYLQRLGGWVDSYEDRVTRLDLRAKQFGMSREQYIAALRASPDPKVRSEAANIAAWPIYLDKYGKMHQSMQNGPTWMQPVKLAQNYSDPAFRPIVEATLEAYRPGTQLTGEGIAFGAGGFVLGWLLTGVAISILGLPLTLARRVRRGSRRLPKLVSHNLDERV